MTQNVTECTTANTLHSSNHRIWHHNSLFWQGAVPDALLQQLNVHSINNCFAHLFSLRSNIVHCTLHQLLHTNCTFSSLSPARSPLVFRRRRAMRVFCSWFFVRFLRCFFPLYYFLFIFYLFCFQFCECVCVWFVSPPSPPLQPLKMQFSETKPNGNH